MATSDRISLVTGPARSGKSEWAEALAIKSGQSVVYIATSSVDPTDLDWQKRVELHRDRRPAHWQLKEVPIALPEALLAATAQDCLLIDSLGTWLANLLEQDDATWQQTVRSLVESLRQTPATVILVSEETGWGVVPAYPIGRLFRDRLGSLTRQVGTVADAVYLVVAGYAVDVKALGTKVDEGMREFKIQN
ncbi:bifunctional adenosylcobinamide kinase/adenosylcobinamide-phosphate guanylyltransferase [Nodosilinea sp. AN01ver1]|uniref:bifunctional adenosylcobinamide kinase/adenosylcobinamide-phosphate guanylyltransferase n=1 Tax=Nodosilinea sp. AN01ver1 TaxID=3423362 RepID=UPI003D319B3C